MEEKDTKILFAWERDRPVCMVEKMKDGGGVSVSLLRGPDIKLRAEPELRKRGYKEKLVFLPPPRERGEERTTGNEERGEFKLTVGDDGYARLDQTVKLLIVIPDNEEKIPPPVLIDTVPIDDAVSYKDEKTKTRKLLEKYRR